jgi:hypothetical protein
MTLREVNLRGATPRDLLGPANVVQIDSANPAPPQVAIRQRPPRSGVPAFSQALTRAQSLQNGNVLLDKVDYQVNAPVSFPSKSALRQFIADMGAVQPHPLIRFIGGPRAAAGSDRIRLKIENGWHMSGEGELRIDAQLRGHIFLRMSLNPTRWVSYLQEVNLEAIAERGASELLRVASARASRGSLDQNDNLLANRDRLGTPSADLKVFHFIELTRIYLTKVEELLRTTLGSSHPPGMTLTRPSLKGASYAETYLEWLSDDAISEVEAFRLMAIAGMSDPRYSFQRKRVSGGHVRNSPSVTIAHTKTVDFVIYAKTARTVRTEVRYKSDLREQAFHRGERGQARTPISELVGLRADAVRRIRSIMEGYEALRTPTATEIERDVFQLCAALLHAWDNNQQKAHDLFRALRVERGLTPTGADGIAPLPVVTRLERAKVLHRVRYRHGNARGEARYCPSSDDLGHQH